MNIQKSFEEFNMKGLNVVTSLQNNPAGEPHFFVKDLHGNLFQVIQGRSFFSEKRTNADWRCSGCSNWLERY